MRIVGLLGGMSWESSAEYYAIANRLVAERLGGLHSARILLASVDFAGIEELQRAGDWDAAGAELAAAAVDIPLLHIGDVTADAVRAAGLTRVGLLGTAFTMERPFLRERLASHGLEVTVPGDDDRALVHRVIYDELCRGIVREESRAAYRDVIGRLVDGGAEGVVLGCTEIELLVTAADSPVPVFPTTRLHMAAGIDAALR